VVFDGKKNAQKKEGRGKGGEMKSGVVERGRERGIYSANKEQGDSEISEAEG
jgi:hypothetical protein